MRLQFTAFVLRRRAGLYCHDDPPMRGPTLLQALITSASRVGRDPCVRGRLDSPRRAHQKTQMTEGSQQHSSTSQQQHSAARLLASQAYRVSSSEFSSLSYYCERRAFCASSAAMGKMGRKVTSPRGSRTSGAAARRRTAAAP